MVQDPTLELRCVRFCSVNWFINNLVLIPRINFFLKTACLHLFSIGIEWTFIGMLFADSKLSMGPALKIANQSGETNTMTAESDYSIYTLQQLLRARHWLDANRGRWLEDEIQKRCAHFQEPNKRKGSAATRSGSRYRPYGLMLGVFFLVVSSGPFLAVHFLDTMNLVPDVNGDNALLSGAWAVLTLPFAVMIYMIGGIMDAERVVKWFKL
jgi:hypothetical protein